MSEHRGLPYAGESHLKREQAIWSFFDAYKTAGEGRAVTRPDMQSFSHVSEETKQKDRGLLEMKKGRPRLRQQRETGPDAFAFENYLTTQAKEHHWFGGELSPTTEFDDWISGADAVIEWSGDGEPIRLAVDFTSAEDASTFLRKSDKLEGNVQLKYLRSEVEKEGGRPKEMRASMPIVLLGFDESIFRVLAQSREMPDGNHPLRRLLIEQAASQIDLQIKLFLAKAFESPKSRRTKKLAHAREGYSALGANFSADQAIDFLAQLEQVEIDALLNEKLKARLKDLGRVRHQLGLELQRCQEIVLDESWEKIAHESKTHQILSG